MTVFWSKEQNQAVRDRIFELQREEGMARRADGADVAPKRAEGQVERVVSLLEKTEDRLKEVVAHIEDRFTVVLRDETTEKDEVEAEQVEMVTLARSLTSLNNRLNRDIDRLGTMIERCEL